MSQSALERTEDRGTGTGFFASIRRAFRLDTSSGRGEALALVIVFITPILAFYISVWFLLLLVVALAVTFVAVPRAARARGEQSRLAQAGLAMTVNGVALFLSMIVIGFIEDFIGHSEVGFRGHDIIAILTVVHILLGVGLQLWDSFRD